MNIERKFNRFLKPLGEKEKKLEKKNFDVCKKKKRNVERERGERGERGEEEMWRLTVKV